MSIAPRKPALLSKHQRDAIERELSTTHGQVRLKIDGHAVTLQVQRFKVLRWVVFVFVDGEVRGEHFKPESAIGAKFWRPETRCLFGRKAIEAHAKEFGKRSARQMQAKYTRTIHHPWFRSARGFLSHVQRTCNGIEVVQLGWSRRDVAVAEEAVAHA